MKAGTRKSPRKSSRSRQNIAPVSDPFDDTDTYAVVTPIAKGGVACPFPWRLHEMLEFVHQNEMDHIVSWEDKGKAFTVHDSKAFVSRILPRFFSQTKYASFQRQLNLYGFSRKRAESSLSCYFHQCFRREDPDLVRNMVRCKIKGTGKNRQGSKKPTTKKSVRKQAAVESSTTPADSPPVTPVRVEHSSSSSADENGSIATMHEEQDTQPYETLSSTATSFPFDDDGLIMDDAQTIEEMVFFEGSPFHLLESEPMATIDHDGMPHSISQAPVFPYSSFRADTVTPRMKLQPRSSRHNGLMSSDFFGGRFL